MGSLSVKPWLGSSKPQRLASSSESGIVAPVPQLAQFKSTSSAEGLIMDHWALLMIKDPEDPHLLQATPFPSISWRTHHACSPETYMPATTTGTALARRTHQPLGPLPLRLGRRSRRNL